MPLKRISSWLRRLTMNSNQSLSRVRSRGTSIRRVSVLTPQVCGSVCSCPSCVWGCSSPPEACEGLGRGIALIAVIHNNVVGIAKLRRGLGVLLELLHDVRRIHQGDHPIDAALGRQIPIGQERLHGWSRRGEARGLDENAVKRHRLHRFTAAGEQVMDRRDQVPPYGATEAAVAELDYVLLDSNDQTAIDTHLAKLIHNHRNALIMLRAQDAIDQGRLA